MVAATGETLSLMRLLALCATELTGRANRA